MALKPIEPGAGASRAERESHDQAREQARQQPHLWANGPEHQRHTQAPKPDPARGETPKK
jgi:hypothetical protein